MVILEKNLSWGRVGKAELKKTTCDKTGKNTLCLSIDTSEEEYGEINLSLDFLKSLKT